MIEKKENLGFRANPARAKEIRIAAAQRGQSIQEMLDEGLALLLAGKPSQNDSTIASDGPKAIESPNLGEISGERKEWVLKLLRILQSKEEEVIQQTIHIIELGVERINAGSDVSIAQSARDHIDAPVKGAGTHRKKSGRASGK